MSVHRLEPFWNADPSVHSIATRSICVQLESMGPGPESFVCGHCDEVVLRNVNPQQIQGFAFECEKCGGHGIFPPEHDFYPDSERKIPPPQTLAAGSRVDPAELRSQLADAIAWLDSIGVSAQQGRVAAYLRGVPLAGLMDQIAFAESREIVEIYSALRHIAHTEYFRDRLKRMAGGPISMQDERPGASSNAARNFAFELAIAARMVASGIDLDTSIHADVAVDFDRRRFALQCKRPMNESKVETALRKAQAQLKRNYQESDPSTIGLIVVDLTKVVGFDRRPATGSFEDVYRRHHAYLDEFKQRRRGQLTKFCGGTKTVGLLARVQEIVLDGTNTSHAVNWSWQIFDWATARDAQSVHALALRFRDHTVAQHKAKEAHVEFVAERP